jgi:biopolymer transport protein ExbD
MAVYLPTASMGDIAFLLIIFFMLASNFMKTANVKAEDPVSADVEKQDAPQVTVVLDEDGTVWLQGVAIGITELAGGVQAAVGDHRERPVHVRIHRTHRRKDFLPVIEALSEAGVRMVLAGEQAQE